MFQKQDSSHWLEVLLKFLQHSTARDQLSSCRTSVTHPVHSRQSSSKLQIFMILILESMRSGSLQQHSFTLWQDRRFWTPSLVLPKIGRLWRIFLITPFDIVFQFPSQMPSQMPSQILKGQFGSPYSSRELSPDVESKSYPFFPSQFQLPSALPLKTLVLPLNCHHGIRPALFHGQSTCVTCPVIRLIEIGP